MLFLQFSPGHHSSQSCLYIWKIRWETQRGYPNVIQGSSNSAISAFDSRKCFPTLTLQIVSTAFELKRLLDVWKNPMQILLGCIYSYNWIHESKMSGVDLNCRGFGRWQSVPLFTLICSGTVSIMWLVMTWRCMQRDLFRKLKRFTAFVMVLCLSEFHSIIGDLINRPVHFCFTIFTKYVLLFQQREFVCCTTPQEEMAYEDRVCNSMYIPQNNLHVDILPHREVRQATDKGQVSLKRCYSCRPWKVSGVFQNFVAQDLHTRPPLIAALLLSLRIHVTSLAMLSICSCLSCCQGVLWITAVKIQLPDVFPDLHEGALLSVPAEQVSETGEHSCRVGTVAGWGWWAPVQHRSSAGRTEKASCLIDCR